MSSTAEQTILEKLKKLDHLVEDVGEVKQLLRVLSKRDTAGQLYEKSFRQSVDDEMKKRFKEADW